jgi:hypothetical protein
MTRPVPGVLPMAVIAVVVADGVIVVLVSSALK